MKSCWKLIGCMRRLMGAFLFVICWLSFPMMAHAESWSVFVYMCGSDLETNYGAASADIAEMLDARASDKITVIMQTGGARQWQNSVVPSDRLVRYLLKDGDLISLGEGPQVSMGDGRTLFEFIAFCQENYAADHQILLIWDHGGGSVFGFANDENFDFDSVSLGELRSALSSVYGDKIAKKPFDIIGFDACLMATADTAASIAPYADYMVASQELEPGNGWQYTRWLNALAKNPDQSAEQLGKTMCDAYLAGCEEAGTAETATLALIDLKKINPMLKAWNIFGMYALMQATEDDSFYAAIGRAASRSENFSNSKSTGYSNMVDMGGFISQLSDASKERHPAADEMLKFLHDAVIYKVSGPARHVSGLSCYYPFDSDEESYRNMLDNGLINSFMLAYGLQHGFIDGLTANSMLEAITADGAADALPSVAAPQMSETPPEQSGNATDMIASTVNHGVEVALQALLSQRPAQDQDPVAFIAGLIHDNLQVIAQSMKPVEKLDIGRLEDHPVDLVTKDDGSPAFELSLDASYLRYIDSVRFYLAMLGDDEGVTVFGDDIDMEQDWDTGVFRDNFNGTWPALDGHIVYLETTADLEDYNYYSIPVILNGVKSSIEALYDFKEHRYVVLGARRITTAGVPDKNLVKLRAGDRITTLMQKMGRSDDDTAEVEGASFALGESWSLEDRDLADGTYAYIFSMSDIQGNEALSDVAFIEIVDGNITYGEI